MNREGTTDVREWCRRVGKRTLELNLTFLLAPKDEMILMLQTFICTNKLLFQNAITHGMIKPTALAIALNSIKSSAIRVIIWVQRGRKRCIFQLPGDGKENDLGHNFPNLLHNFLVEYRHWL